MNNTLKISLFSILFLAIGFMVGFVVYNEHLLPVTSEVDNIEEASMNDSMDKNDVMEQKVATNKLFEFLDSKKGFYTDPVDTKEGGGINISDIEPSLGLMVVDYSVNLEGSEFSVYDYNNDLWYKKIGFDGLGEYIEFLTFVNKDNVLLYSYSEPKNFFALILKNFRNNTEKILPIKIENINGNIEAHLNSKNFVIIYVDTKNGFKTYKLNPQTFELTEDK